MKIPEKTCMEPYLRETVNTARTGYWIIHWRLCHASTKKILAQLSSITLVLSWEVSKQCADCWLRYRATSATLPLKLSFRFFKNVVRQLIAAGTDQNHCKIQTFHFWCIIQSPNKHRRAIEGFSAKMMLLHSHEQNQCTASEHKDKNTTFQDFKT